MARLPVLDVIRRYPKEIVLSALLRMSEQAPFYLYTAFALSYMIGIVAFPFFLLLNTAALGFIILGTALIAIAPRSPPCRSSPRPGEPRQADLEGFAAAYGPREPAASRTGAGRGCGWPRSSAPSPG